MLSGELVGGAGEEREEAGSLAALGMTNQKSNGNSKGKNAFVRT